jgi:hypothetical protein
MRSTVTRQVNTLLLALLASGLWLQTCRAQFQSGAPAEPSSSAGEPITVIGTVEGWGEDEQQAREDALKKAIPKVEKYLRSLVPPLEWAPSPAFIRDHFIKAPQRLEDRGVQDVVGNSMKCWGWKVGLSARDWQQILQLDRELRVQQRMAFLARILAGLLALLAVIAGYIRLDEWTKGYYRGWLRAAAASLLVIVGTGLWWFS